MQDEICKSIAENGGIDAVLRCIDDSGEQGNKIVARACCSLLSKVRLDHYSKSFRDFFLYCKHIVKTKL